MYCQKCGEKALDGAEFCQNCGAKLVQDTAGGTPGPTVSVQRGGTTPAGTKKKSRVSIVLGIAGGILLILVLLALIGGGDEPSTPSGGKDIVLSEAYTNEAEGISFRYPSAWEPMSAEEIADYYEISEEDLPVLVLLSNEIDDAILSTIEVSKFDDATQGDADWLFSSDEEFAATITDTTWIDTSLTELDGIPARELMYIGTNGMYSRSYLYMVGSNLYQVLFYCHENQRSEMDPFFDAVIESYKISADAQSQQPEPAGTDGFAPDVLCFNGVPVVQLLGASYEDMIFLLGEPDYSLYEGGENSYGDAIVNFDMYSTDTPYLSTIYTPWLNEFTYNGQPLSADRDAIVQLFGQEPDEDRVYYDTYIMTYCWDHLGYEASLTLEWPSTDESTAATAASLSWWVTSETTDGGTSAPPAGYALPNGFAWIEMPSTISDGWITTITGIVQNTSSQACDYVSISFNLYDASGNQVGTTTDFVTNLQAGGTWKFEAPLFEENVTRFEFVELTFY